MGALGGAACRQTSGQAILTPELDEQLLTRAEKLSLLTVKAHAFTLQYQQVNSGCLMELVDLSADVLEITAPTKHFTLPFCNA